jgi:hypothetical protein
VARVVTDQQVRKLMEETNKHGNASLAAMKAGMDRKTARKYLRAGRLPSESKPQRHWRTREDPFEADWPRMAGMLEAAPELEGKALFEHLLASSHGRYTPGQLRTFQRRVRDWSALHGPGQEVFFAQEHRPGERAQTDFTWATELGVTIAGELYVHMLCHFVLPYSNWQCATPCRSESMSALSEGVQAAVFRLGKVPRKHQTDNSTAATHDLRTGKRGFNTEYEALINHLGMAPCTTGVGEKEQNGDVEAANGALKRRLTQHLILRGSRDFDSVADYRAWLDGVIAAANALRDERVLEELRHMKDLVADRLATFREEDVGVSPWSTIRVKFNTYSVPCRLIGEQVRVRIYDDRLEVRFAGVLQASIERLLGRLGHRINYRHVIWSLVRKPGAFRRYKYRDDLYPTVRFRAAYDALCEALSEGKADMEYVRVLHFAASTMESEVDVALSMLLEAGQLPTLDEVRALVAPAVTPHPELAAYQPDLTAYDALLREVA